jgi:hypothetical protein
MVTISDEIIVVRARGIMNEEKYENSGNRIEICSCNT